jgi:serine/threonine protein kinase
VEALLAYGDDDDSGILATSVSGVSLEDSPPAPNLNKTPQSLSPSSIGEFEILRKLGEGNMGTVFLAEQAAPMHRRVAIKVIRRGLESEEAVVRFELEKRALALLNHPGIAQVYEAGRTTDDRSYFVMEYVSGEPITTFCDHQQSTIEERLRLFIAVCDAVQHAHYRGVIHRDLKPSNILISNIHSDPRPKVIDFGVAKAPWPAVAQPAQTSFGRVVGTLDYMSPEQLRQASRVDTRADVYSLGALLYDLLVGEVVHQADPDASFDEFFRRLREDDPLRPSVRFCGLPQERRSRIARLRTIGDTRLPNRLVGDLDHILAKALERDPNRRYRNVKDLSDNLERHLNHVPVTARAPSTLYRAQKFARKNRGFIVAVSAIVLVSLCGTLVSLGLRSKAITRHSRTNGGAPTSATLPARVGGSND